MHCLLLLLLCLQLLQLFLLFLLQQFLKVELQA